MLRPRSPRSARRRNSPAATEPMNSLSALGSAARPLSFCAASSAGHAHPHRADRLPRFRTRLLRRRSSGSHRPAQGALPAPSWLNIDYVPNQSFSAGFGAGSAPPPGHDPIGLWLIPICLLLGGGILFLTSASVSGAYANSAVRRLSRPRRSPSYPRSSLTAEPDREPLHQVVSADVFRERVLHVVRRQLQILPCRQHGSSSGRSIPARASSPPASASSLALLNGIWRSNNALARCSSLSVTSAVRI